MLFFTVEISILVDPKQISVVSKSEKQKEGPLLIIISFPLPIYIFLQFPYNFL